MKRWCQTVQSPSIVLLRSVAAQLMARGFTTNETLDVIDRVLKAVDSYDSDDYIVECTPRKDHP